nr:AlpA family phage regulatory protein [Pseudomonas sp. C1C7]
MPEVRALTTLSTSEIYRRIAAGTFPKQVKLGPKSSVWPLSAVLDFIDENVRKSREELD